MADPRPPFDSGQSFCGNCGTAVRAEDSTCENCGMNLAAAEDLSGGAQPPPHDYVPYCRSCGTRVPWAESHSCQRCGVAPLCSEHFDFESGMCGDCATAQAPAGRTDAGAGFDPGSPPSGPWAQARPSVPCSYCGARIRQGVRHCPQCGSEQAFDGSPGGTADVEYAGFWVRFGAFLIDWLITLAVGVLIGLAGVPIVGPVFIISYFVGFTAKRGQTPGKQLLRIQVVDADGQVPRLQAVLLREALRALMIVFILLGEAVNDLFVLVTLVGMVGYLWVAWDAHKRGWHDYLGRTFVVRKPRPNI